MSEMGDVLKVVESLRDKHDRSTDRIHEKMDTMLEKQGHVETRLCLVEAAMPVQPCAEMKRTKEELEDHLEVHDETRKTVKVTLLRGTLGLAFLACGTVITLWIKGVI